MKIALVSQEYQSKTGHGGIGTQTLIKGNGLSALGHKVFIISRSHDFNRYEQTENDVCTILIPGKVRDFPEMTDPVKWFMNSLFVAKEIDALNKRVGLDIIDFPEYGAEGFFYLLNRTDWNKIPVVLQLHGPLVMLARSLHWPDLGSEFYRTGTFMEATCFRNADAVYSSSKCSADWCLKYYHPRTDSIPILHTGIDIDLFSPKPENSSQEPVVLFLGRIAESKGIGDLVDVVCRLSGEIAGLKLRIIGNGEAGYVDQLKEKAALTGNPEILEFAGFVEKKKLPEEISKAQVFAAPSLYEGGPGFVYLEAMACGLPVIGCSGSGIEEIIEHGKNGLLVPPGDKAELGKAIRNLLHDKLYAGKIGEEARKYAVGHADKNVCLKKIEEFYSSVIKRCQ